MNEKPGYKDTLNLPRTDFPMKANLHKLEPRLQEEWAEVGIEEELLKRRSDQKVFILHDGPPYANGDIHLGHTLNKVLKDIIVRSKSMTGFYSPYVPGWDCHGQPIEHEVEKRLSGDKSEISKSEIRQLCREYALNFVDRQREQFKRLGVSGLWDRPYLTMDRAYEGTIVRVFKELYRKGLVYKGRKPIHWCYRCRTALAEAEIEHEDAPSSSIYIRFPVLEGSSELDEFTEPKSLLVWTTTPWTLPANVAVAVNPVAEYVASRVEGEILVLAKELVDNVQEVINRKLDIVASFKGEALSKVVCRRPLEDEKSIVVMADFVELDQGTGCVHIAPGHGQEDYVVGLKYNLASPVPVDESGKFTAEAGQFAGQHINKANSAIVEELEKRELLVHSETITHSYPHCWRCKSPVIFRATEQWFISMKTDDLRKKALQAVGSVKWIPEWSIKRITGMIADRPDWCISRQRSWGVPIPVFYCLACDHVLATDQVLEKIEKLFAEEGADAWFKKDPEQMLPEGTTCDNCGSKEFRKEEDILDVWFESGVSHAAVLEGRGELSWPADLYLEGSDQHRGWFQSSMLTSVGTRSAAPYRQVLTHGFLVDGTGRKMSKSRGNVVNPLKVIERSGADILRLWVCSADFSSDVAVSDEILARISEAYRRIRNTIRFLLGSLGDFNPATDMVEYEKLESIDKWALMKLHELTKKAKSGYDEYKLHQVFHSAYNFCSVDMSSFYLDVLKDTLYTMGSASKKRRSAQSAIYEICETLIKVLAPVLAFTAEEAWDYLPDVEGREKSVHLSKMPDFNNAYIELETKGEWEQLLAVRQEVTKAIEEARAAKIVGGSLQAKVLLSPPEELANLLASYKEMLPAIFIVSQVKICNLVEIGDNPWKSPVLSGLSIGIVHAEGLKCARCWNFKDDVGDDKDHQELCGRCVEVIDSLS